MDLGMARIDLVTVGSNNRNTLKILPSAKKKRQKVVIGDTSGVVTCVVLKKGDTETVFKNSNPTHREVTALSLGGARDLKDKIYVAFGQTIVGLKKKGASFFQFNTNLSEDISNLYVEDKMIWSSSQYMLNIFDNCNDAFLFMAGDQINDLLVAPLVEGGYYNTALACQDKFLRILKDSDEQLSFRGDSAITALCAPPHLRQVEHDEKAGTTYRQLLYGADDGLVGQLLVDGLSLREGIVVDNEHKKGSVTCLQSADLSGDGAEDLIIGRDDGALEILTLDHSGRGPHYQSFSRHLAESITSVQTGHVHGLGGVEDVVVATFSGKVIAFSNDSGQHAQSLFGGKRSVGQVLAKAVSVVHGAPGVDASPAAVREAMEEAKVAVSSKSVELRAEIEALRQQLDEAKMRMARANTEVIAAEKLFPVKSSLKLLPQEACFQLSLEAPMPLELVVLQSQAPLHVMDLEGNAAVMVEEPRDHPNEQSVMTFRCHEASNRLQLKIRTLEGYSGALKAFVIPKITPKTCQEVTFSVKSLSLHDRVHADLIADQLRQRNFNTLTIFGHFNLNELHAWVGSCLPEVPPKMTDEEVVLHFRSTYMGSILVCQYTKGRGTFRSDSMAAISILKDVLTREATNKKIAINVSLDLKEESIIDCLELLRHHMETYLALAHQHSLIEPLQEIQMHEAQSQAALAAASAAVASSSALPAAPASAGLGLVAPITAEDGIPSCLSEEFRYVLKNADFIKEQFAHAPKHIEFLRGVVLDLYDSRYHLHGRRPNLALRKQLEQTLTGEVGFDKIVAAFKQADKDA